MREESRREVLLDEPTKPQLAHSKLWEAVDTSIDNKQ